MRWLTNISLFILSASTTYLLILALRDGIRPKHKAHTPGLNDELTDN